MLLQCKPYYAWEMDRCPIFGVEDEKLVVVDFYRSRPCRMYMYVFNA